MEVVRIIFEAQALEAIGATTSGPEIPRRNLFHGEQRPPRRHLPDQDDMAMDDFGPGGGSDEDPVFDPSRPTFAS